MVDINDKLAAAANSGVHRSSYQATSPKFGMNRPALGTITGGTLPEGMQQDVQEAASMVRAMQEPLEILKAQSENKEPELSLDTVTDEQKEKIMKAFTNCRDIAENHYTSVVEDAIRHRREVYEADVDYYKRMFPRLSETSNWVSKDVKTSCSWILCGMMEAFCGSDAPLSVKGVNVDDDEIASKIQELVRYQLEKKNDWYNFCQTTISYALSENFAVAKVWWKREEERTPMEMMLDLKSVDEIISLVMASTSGDIDNLSFEEIEDTDDFLKVSYEQVRLKSNHPVVEYVPTSEIRYTPDAANIHDCKFVAHRKVVRGDYLKRRERDGIYKNIDTALEKYDKGNTMPSALDYDYDVDRFSRSKVPDDNDNASKEMELYEAYLQVDYNNDGIYENIIVHAIGDEPIRIAKNDFDFPPFFICESQPSPNAVFNKDSSTDSLEQQQHLKTALIRQVITNLAKNNAPRIFVNDRNVDMDALLSGNEIISVMGNPGENVFVPPSLPISGMTMDLINYAQNEIEAQSGSTRYNQGLDSNSLNSTATGITAILGMAEKRNKMVARSIAEKFFIPIYKFIILLDQKYMRDEEMVRLTNKTLSIRKEDLDIDYDLIVNVGQGASTREAQIQYLLLVMSQLYPQLANAGIANAKSWYNLGCKLLEALGLRDVSQYLLDPESEQAQLAARQAQQAQAQAQAEALQNSLQLSIAKSSVPRVTVDVSKLPPDVQKDFIQKKFGITTTERAIAEHEVLMQNG
ncbi:MAG: hypothetical protein LUG91_08995 [Ruminococcus sp.]|nr:hypothetical protein [Ruminococcus sp.]